MEIFCRKAFTNLYGHLETRYYFSKAMEKWYVGVNMGMAVYDMQKWNYWNT
ncbi:DUF3575 domain-containing protein, partial [Elizabethkingia anophelis]|uniref:DUF3575 domain-containing protein n=1 Tax=Elizabethkingia anophelis TaxID=1117645 RepID=UPI003892B315